jgi:CheY-like chemotaxis protein
MLKILIVEDSKSAQLKIHSILSEYGQCDQAFNGQEGVDCFNASLQADSIYDLVVMDIVMPIMNGLEAAKEIMRIQDQHRIPEEKRAKIIMLTSKADPSHMMKAHFEAGVETYVTKPFKDSTLIEAIGNLGLFQG